MRSVRNRGVLFAIVMFMGFSVLSGCSYLGNDGDFSYQAEPKKKITFPLKDFHKTDDVMMVSFEQESGPSVPINMPGTIAANFVMPDNTDAPLVFVVRVRDYEGEDYIYSVRYEAKTW